MHDGAGGVGVQARRPGDVVAVEAGGGRLEGAAQLQHLQWAEQYFKHSSQQVIVDN